MLLHVKSCAIDKKVSVCYYVAMINKIKNKYYRYQPGEFLPIYMDGQLANRKAFHMYKLKRATTPVISRLLHTI